MEPEVAFLIVVLLLFSGIVLVVLGLPGSMLIVLAAFFCDLSGSFPKLGLRLLLMLFLFGVLSEVIGFSLELKSSFRFLPTLENAAFALLGSLAGVYFLTPFFLGAGIIMGIFGGAFSTLLAKEIFKQIRLKPAFRVSMGSFLLAVVSTMIKGFFAVAMSATVLINIYS